MATNPFTPLINEPPLRPEDPTVLRAGDSWLWGRYFAGFASGQGWTVLYILNSPQARFAFPAGVVTQAADGVGFLVSLTAAQTAQIAPGRYDLYATLSNVTLGAQQTFLLQSVRVEPNIASAEIPVDTRSWVKKTLDMLEAAMLGDTSPHVQEYEIQGRRLQYMDRLKLKELRDQYRYEYRQEQIAAGEYVPKRRVGVRFLPNY